MSATTTSRSSEYSKSVLESEAHNSTSAIITVAVVVGFITLAVTGILLFLKITRGLRGRRERRRRKGALEKKQGSEDKLSAREQAGRRKGRGRNAFEEEEWEGVPA